MDNKRTQHKRVMAILDIQQATPRWSNYLSKLVDEGYIVDLVTLKTPNSPLPKKILKSESFSHFETCLTTLYGQNRIKNKIHFFIQRFTTSPTQYVSLYDKLAIRSLNRKAKQLLNRFHYEFLITSSSPFYTHIIASQIVNKYDLIWIADYRDLWSQNHVSQTNDSLKESFERSILANASACITVSQGCRRDLRNVYQGPIHVLYNGFEKMGHAKDIPKSDKYRILYTGQIYRKYQQIDLLLEYLSDVDESISEKFIFEFVGNSSKFISKNFSKQFKSIPKNVYLSGELDHLETIEQQEKADFLLFLAWNSQTDRGVVPTKIYEYIGSGTPILSFGEIQEGECGRLLAKSRNFLRIQNVKQLQDFFHDCLTKRLEIEARNSSFVEKFKFNSQIKTLDAILTDYTTEKESVSF